VVGLDTVVFERVRASLRGSPFRFSGADPGQEEPDLYIARVQDLGELGRSFAPIIACGPAGLLRSAFLGGCADYLRDPWAPEELALRAAAVLSRQQRQLEFPWGRVSFDGQDLRTPRGLVALTRQESKVVRLLLRARGEPVPRAALACELWGDPSRATGRAVDVHVAAVRKKVRRVEALAGRFIMCVRGAGYMIP
jgi:DNA-binding winged helix-turn-helix (wHTH) protein